MVETKRPPAGVGHYLRDLVYGGLDGAITTLAVIASVSGASLGVRVAAIVGIANLVADGISMGASNYLGLKSDLQQAGQSVSAEMPWRHGLATMGAFAAAGLIPLLGYLATPWPEARMPVAAVLSGTVLFWMGASRAPFVARPRFRCGVEMLAVGALAGGAAFLIGGLARALL